MPDNEKSSATPTYADIRRVLERALIFEYAPVDNHWGCFIATSFIKEILDLINRQQAEIERLQKKVEELSEVLSDTIRIRYAEAKAEAVQEFAERLKFKFNNITYSQPCEYIIDNLVKEMEGEG